MVDRDAFAGLPAELHADVLSRLSPADIARYRVAASASKPTAAHSDDIAELAAREALLAFAERTYTDFVKGAREVWTDGTEYSADANDMCRLVEEPLGPVTRLGAPHGRREWPEIVQVLACDPDSFEPLDLTEGVYERHVSDGRVTMMTYDDGEWDGAPRRGIGRRDAALSELIAPLPGETWLGCWAATCAFVAAGTNAALGACRTDRRTDRPSRPPHPLAPLPEKGYPGLIAPICLQRRRRQLLWLMFGGADARGVDERAQIGIGVVCVYATLNYVRYLGSLGVCTRGFEAARPRAIATAERLASIGRWELAAALIRAAVPEMESDPPNAPRAVEEISEEDSKTLAVSSRASSRCWCHLRLLDSSFPHTKSEDPSVVRHVESNIAVSNWFIDRVYAGTVVNQDNLQDIESISLSVILTSQAIREMYTVVCKDGERGLSLEEAVTRDLARTAGGLSVQGNYPSALARLAAAMQARARALGIMAQHLGLDAFNDDNECRMGPPLFIWPHECEREPTMYKVKNRHQRMAHIAKACAEMPRFPDSEFFLFDDSNHTLMKKEVDPNVYFAVEDLEDYLCSGGWCPITEDTLTRISNTDGWDRAAGLGIGFMMADGWEHEDHIRVRFREAALAARTAVDIWRAMDDKRRMYTAIAVYGEVSYCHASALLGGLRQDWEVFADMPGHQVSDALDNYVNGVCGLLAVAKWSMEMSIAGLLRTFGADAALDIANVQKDLGKVLSHVWEVFALAMRVRDWLMQRHLIEEPVDHLSSFLDLMRRWLGVFRVDGLDDIGEIRDSATRHYRQARGNIESHLGEVHPWTRNIRRLANYGSEAPASGLGMICDEMSYLENAEREELFGWKTNVMKSHGA